MDRTRNYEIGFIVSAILFLIFNNNGIIDAIIFIAFVLSSLALIYSLDVLPTSKESLKVPEIHYYYKSRMNVYGYSMAGMMVVLSMLFALLSMFLNLRLGLTVVILWLLAVIGSRVIIKFTRNLVDKNSIYDFVINSLQLQDTNSRVQATLLLDFLTRNNVKQDTVKTLEKEIVNVINSNRINRDLAIDVINEYLYYTTPTNKLSSDEINASNKLK